MPPTLPNISRGELVEEVLTHFIGAIDQVPPAFSACMVDGKRAYELVRKGEEVELKSKTALLSTRLNCWNVDWMIRNR